MKEAAGEANMTVITIVLIAIVLAVGTVIVRNMMSNTNNSSACSACGGSWQAGKCVGPDGKQMKADDWNSCKANLDK